MIELTPKYSTCCVQVLSKLKSTNDVGPDVDGLQPLNVGKNRRRDVIPGTSSNITTCD